MNYWLEHCEAPRTRPSDIDWDVFVSYRSLDRTWAIALYDMLAQCGYKAFIDQFVLVAGQGLPTQLGENLARSNSGVLLWSERTSESTWVKAELNAMVARQLNSQGTADPFNFVVAKLDKEKAPALTGGVLFVDFSDYPDGPMGADIVRLTCGLQGKPLSPPAVARLVAFEREMKEEPATLRALAKTKRFTDILARIKGESPAYTTSATLLGLAIDQLIRGKEERAALEGIEVALSRFPGSLRLRQLQGLALRRDQKLTEAAFRLTLLVEQGHRDPETLGILAAVHADLWEEKLGQGDTRGARDALEESRNLYREAFKRVPTDTYVGINAAAKSALLGELEEARSIATDVLKRLAEAQAVRGASASPDYWERATEAEALLLRGDAERALALYHDARVAHRHEAGSIKSTGTQVKRLLGVLEVAPDVRQKLLAEFEL